jgi:antirestriction protein ArdC
MSIDFTESDRIRQSIDPSTLPTKDPELTAEAQMVLKLFPNPPRIVGWDLASGVFDPNTDQIHVPTLSDHIQHGGTDEAHRYGIDLKTSLLRTFVHELAHSTGHITRLWRNTVRIRADRPIDFRFVYFEECIADMTASIVLADIGKLTPQCNNAITDYVFEYATAISQKSTQTVAETLRRAGRHALIAADYILGRPVQKFKTA